MTNYSDRSYEGSGQNYIHNSFFRINTRALPITSNGFVSDRWVIQSSGSMVWSATVDTTIVPNTATRASEAITITTADTSIAAGDYMQIFQSIEGYDFLPFVGRTGVVSFWVRSSVPGTYCVSARNGGADRSYIREYTIDSANTWEFKEVIIPFNYSGGTWDYVNGRGLYLTWALAVGSTFQTTPNTWATGNYIGTSNQVNATDTSGNTFYLSNPKFEIGNVATPFIDPNYGIEYLKCQRYREYRYYVENAVSVGTGNGNYYFYLPYQVKKRAVPTISVTSSRLYIPATGWYASTGTSFTESIDGSLCLFQDTARSTYTVGQHALVDGTFTINAEI